MKKYGVIARSCATKRSRDRAAGLLRALERPRNADLFNLCRHCERSGSEAEGEALYQSRAARHYWIATSRHAALAALAMTAFFLVAEGEAIQPARPPWIASSLHFSQ
jgi:hypothetical protein